jgi:hypothetical protein
VPQVSKFNCSLQLCLLLIIVYRYNAMIIRLFPGVGGVLSNSEGACISEDDGGCVVAIPWNHVRILCDLICLCCE